VYDFIDLCGNATKSYDDISVEFHFKFDIKLTPSPLSKHISHNTIAPVE